MTIYRIVNLWYTKGAIKINRFPTERPPFPAGVLLFPAVPPKTPPPGLEKIDRGGKKPGCQRQPGFYDRAVQIVDIVLPAPWIASKSFRKPSTALSMLVMPSLHFCAGLSFGKE